MTDLAQLRLVGEEEASNAAPLDEPKVFAKSISAPAGAPWDQTRAAQLEARVGAPLPLAEIRYQVRRLDAWRPGRTARFAAFYIRAGDVQGQVKAIAALEGRSFEVAFISRAEQQSRLRRTTLIAGAVALTLTLLVSSVLVALSARGNAQEQLTDLEQLIDAKARLSQGLDRERREAYSLDASGARDQTLASYLRDLDWASSAKAVGARIQALHWDHGALAVEVRGETAPFVPGGRAVTRVDKPLRPGLWLWGVSGGRGGSSAGPAPRGSDSAAQPP